MVSIAVTPKLNRTPDLGSRCTLTSTAEFDDEWSTRNDGYAFAYDRTCKSPVAVFSFDVQPKPALALTKTTSTTTPIGSFTRDPIGYEGGLDLYEFIGGWVFVGVDPTGLKGGTITFPVRGPVRAPVRGPVRGPGSGPTAPPGPPRFPVRPPRPIVGPNTPVQPQIGSNDPCPMPQYKHDRRRPEDCRREFDDCMTFADKAGQDCRPEHEPFLGMSCGDLVSALQKSCQDS